MYCSEDCRSSSWNDNHFIDCSLLPTLQRLDITEVSFLVMKLIIMMCKNKDFNNILASLKAEENLQNRDLNNKNLNSSDYSTIYWMECHTEKRDFCNLLKRSVTAACILHCIETMTDFFSGHDVSQFKYMLGGLLLRHLQNLTCSAFGVKEMVKSNAEIDELLNWEPGHIGAAVYVTLCLINHSCNPNASQTFVNGDSAKLYALRPVAAGEQVTLI
jgi:SET domain.